MHIIGLKAENFKRLKLVDVRFDPKTNAVIISGDNRQGKSSVLDCFLAAFGGAAALKDTPIPIRRGEDHAEVIVETDELIVTRTWTAAGNTYVKATNKEGWAPSGGVQALLDRLYSAFSFDPLAFSNMEEKKQRDTLLKLVDIGLDLSKWKADRQAKYDQRTAVNREVAELKSLIGSTADVPENTPDEEVSTATVLEEQRQAQSVLNDNKEKRRRLEEENRAARDAVREGNREIIHAVESVEAAQAVCLEKLNRWNHEVKELERQLSEARDFQAKASGEFHALGDKLSQAKELASKLTDPDDMELPGPESLNLKDPDMTVFDEKLRQVEKTNSDVRIKKTKVNIQRRLDTASAKSQELTDAIDAMDKEKADKLASAKMPVEGLSFDDNGLLFNGIPSPQWSDEEAITISTSMGMALNPKLKAMFIREASLMSERSRERLTKMASEHGYQVFMEVVDTSGKLGIYIEDGEVKTIDGQEIKTPEKKPSKSAKKKEVVT